MVLTSVVTVPLACGSFLFFQLVQRVLHRLRTTRQRHQDVLDWRSLSEVLGQPLALPYVMVTGPRWNPHALIAHVGPFQVQQDLRVQVDVAHRSAQMWTLVLYRFSDSQTIATLDSNGVARDAVWHALSLPAGRYSGILRYYQWSPDPRLPALDIDGSRRIHERPISPNDNAYFDRIRNKGGGFYACLHYYVLEMLRLRRYLPESFVRRQYLPVGNPETAFFFGFLRPGQGIEIRSSDGISEGHRLYLTLYNRGSFPVIWAEVRSFPYRTQPIDTTGSYLLRLHAIRSPQAPPSWPQSLQVRAWDL
jgi:hypothetical protein